MLPIIHSMKYFVALLAIYSCFCNAEEKSHDEKAYTYKDCLKDSFLGSHHYTAEETRILCKEITTKNLIYEYINGQLMPADEFTKCFEKMKIDVDKKYKDKGDSKFYELMLEKAKLECDLGGEY